MAFLRRLLGQGSAAASDARETAIPDTDVEASEQAYELELAREDQARTDDLVRRQQRYAQYAWTPPAQGGDRRADDGETDRDST